MDEKLGNTVFENGVLSKYLVPSMRELGGDCKKFYTYETNDIYPYQTLRGRSYRRGLEKLCSAVRERRRTHRDMAGKDEGKRTLERARPKWKDILKCKMM
jgi:hypothetical protein